MKWYLRLGPSIPRRLLLHKGLLLLSWRRIVLNWLSFCLRDAQSMVDLGRDYLVIPKRCYCPAWAIYGWIGHIYLPSSLLGTSVSLKWVSVCLHSHTLSGWTFGAFRNHLGDDLCLLQHLWLRFTAPSLQCTLNVHLLGQLLIPKVSSWLDCWRVCGCWRSQRFFSS